MTETEFTRKNQRQPWEKPFAIEARSIAGGTAVEKYNSIPEYKEAENMSKVCYTYANAYAETMIQRLLNEEPDYFDDKPVGRHEFSLHLQNNICLPVIKYKTAAFQDATAQLSEKAHLTDRIRKLSNGGDKFHPYL